MKGEKRMGKFELTIKKATGSCDTDLFKKMAKKGDISASKIDNLVDSIVKITGSAEVHVATDDKEFDLTYYASDEGYFSTGSKYFKESLEDYLKDTDTFRIIKVKTKNCHTYKAVPIAEGK